MRRHKQSISMRWVRRYIKDVFVWVCLAYEIWCGCVGALQWCGCGRVCVFYICERVCVCVLVHVASGVDGVTLLYLRACARVDCLKRTALLCRSLAIVALNDAMTLSSLYYSS